MKKYYREDVKETYKKLVAPQLKNFEKERKKILSKLIWFEILLLTLVLTAVFMGAVEFFLFDIIIAIIFAILWFQLERVSLIIVPILIFIFIVLAPQSASFDYKIQDILITTLFYIIILLPIWTNKSFQKHMKQSCMPFIINCYHNMKWIQDKNILYEQALIRSKLFKPFKKIVTDDAFTGIYNGIEFYITESSFDNDSVLDKDLDNFKGVIITFNSNKEIKTHTVIVSKLEKQFEVTSALLHGAIFFIAAILPIYYILHEACIVNNPILDLTFLAIITAGFFLWYFFKMRQGKIKLESNDWNKRFKIIQGDEIESRYLLTAGFTDRFNRLMTAFGTKDIKCSFFEDKIMFAISTKKNLFEMGNLFSNVTDSMYMIQFFMEISSILNMIDYFRLDEKTGL